MNKPRKHYETAFKLAVARMVVDQGLSIAQMVKDINVGRTAVSRWSAQHRAKQLGSADISKPITAEVLELLRRPAIRRKAGHLQRSRTLSWVVSRCAA